MLPSDSWDHLSLVDYVKKLDENNQVRSIVKEEIDSTKYVIREPLDSVHDFYKSRCNARSDSLVVDDNGKLVFKVNSKERYEITNKNHEPMVNWMVNKGAGNNTININKVEAKTLEFFENEDIELMDNEVVNLDTLTTDNILEHLSNILFDDLKNKPEIHIGVITDCGIVSKISKNFKMYGDPNKKFNYYNMHLICTNWDEAIKSNKNAFKAEIIHINDDALKVPIFGCGGSFIFKSIQELNKNITGYEGSLKLADLNTNLLSFDMPDANGSDMDIVIPHSLLKSQALNFTVKHMCKSVENNSINGTFFDPIKFAETFGKNKHTYLLTIKQTIDNSLKNLFTNHNVQNNNLFYNLKRSMDAGQVDLIYWLNKNMNDYKLLITEACNNDGKPMHGLCKDIMDPRTLQSIMNNTPLQIDANNIKKSIIEVNNYDNNKVIPRIDRFMLITCDRLCYLKAKFLRVPAIYIADKKAKLFRGDTKTKAEILQEVMENAKNFMNKFLTDDGKKMYTAFQLQLKVAINRTIGIIEMTIKDCLKNIKNEIINIQNINAYPDVDFVRIELLTEYEELEKKLINRVVSSINQIKTFSEMDFNQIEEFFLIRNDLNREIYENLININLEKDEDFFFKYLPKFKRFMDDMKFVDPESIKNVSFDNATTFDDNSVSFSYNVSCKCEPSVKLRKLSFNINNNFDAILLYISNVIDIPFVSIIEATYNILSFDVKESRASRIPQGYPNVVNILDCIRTLRKLVVTFTLRSRSAMDNISAAKQFVNLIKDVFQQNNDYNEEVDMQEGGHIGKKRNRGYFEHIEEIKVPKKTDALNIPELLSYDYESIRTLRIVDEFIAIISPLIDPTVSINDLNNILKFKYTEFSPFDPYIYIYQNISNNLAFLIRDILIYYGSKLKKFKVESISLLTYERLGLHVFNHIFHVDDNMRHSYTSQFESFLNEFPTDAIDWPIHYHQWYQDFEKNFNDWYIKWKAIFRSNWVKSIKSYTHAIINYESLNDDQYIFLIIMSSCFLTLQFYKNEDFDTIKKIAIDFVYKLYDNPIFLFFMLNNIHNMPINQVNAFNNAKRARVMQGGYKMVDYCRKYFPSYVKLYYQS